MTDEERIRFAILRMVEDKTISMQEYSFLLSALDLGYNVCIGGEVELLYKTAKRKVNIRIEKTI